MITQSYVAAFVSTTLTAHGTTAATTAATGIDLARALGWRIGAQNECADALNFCLLLCELWPLNERMKTGITAAATKFRKFKSQILTFLCAALFALSITGCAETTYVGPNYTRYRPEAPYDTLYGPDYYPYYPYYSYYGGAYYSPN